MHQPKIDSASTARQIDAPAVGCRGAVENDTVQSDAAELPTDSSHPPANPPEESSAAKLEDEQPIAIQHGTPDSTLHPSTLWLPCLEATVGTIIPAGIASLWIGLSSVFVFVGFFVLLPTAVFHAIRYFTLRFRVTGMELVIESGVVFRRERRIPFERVQEIEIRQGVVHRILNLAKLEITTAGSDNREASLNVLSKRSAETLKEVIVASPRDGVALPDRGASTSDDSLDYVCRLSTRDLVLGGLTSKLVASLGAVVTALIYFQLFFNVGGDWFNKIERKVDDDIQRRLPGGRAIDVVENLESRLPDHGPLGFVADLALSDTLSRSITLALLGLVFSVVTYVVRYHGFRLTRSGDLLSASHGMLTIRRGSLSRDRIQALKLEEGLLRRWFGLASVRVDSAGDRDQIDDNKKRDVLVPVASKKSACEAAQQALPGLTRLEPEWQRISPRAVMRGSKKGWLLTLLAMVQTCAIAGWYCLIWLPAIPLVYFLNYQWYRHTGYWLDEHFFLSRKGWLNRATVCLPVKNVQNVSVIQNFFDRRLNLATLSIDTAGQSNTGGGPRIRHVPVEEARNIQQALTHRAADCKFGW